MMPAHEYSHSIVSCKAVIQPILQNSVTKLHRMRLGRSSFESCAVNIFETQLAQFRRVHIMVFKTHAAKNLDRVVDLMTDPDRKLPDFPRSLAQPICRTHTHQPGTHD